MIAGLLDDADLCRFTRICRDTHAAVNLPSSAVWRQLFTNDFDMQAGIPNDKLKTVYQHRKALLKRGANLVTGRTAVEQDCLKMLHSLITESYASSRRGQPCTTSRNLETLQKFVDNHNAMAHFMCPKALRKINPLLLVTQVGPLTSRLFRPILIFAFRS